MSAAPAAFKFKYRLAATSGTPVAQIPLEYEVPFQGPFFWSHTPHDNVDVADSATGISGTLIAREKTLPTARRAGQLGSPGDGTRADAGHKASHVRPTVKATVRPRRRPVRRTSRDEYYKRSTVVRWVIRDA